MKLPDQAQPVQRSLNSTGAETTEEIRPQACWCLDDGTGNNYWYCEIGRELYNTQMPCTP